MVFDDCSSDNTVSIIQDTIKKHPDKNIKLNQNPTNLGIAKNCALALEMTVGEYVHLFAADDLMHAEKISKQVKYMENNKEINFCFTNMKWVYPHSFLPFSFLHYSRFLKVHDKVEDLIVDFTIPTPTILWRRSAIIDVPFRDSSSLTADMLFTIEVSLKGKGFYLNENLVTYQRHKNNYTLKGDSYTERKITKETLIKILGKTNKSTAELYNNILLNSLLHKNIEDMDLGKAFKNYFKLIPVMKISNKWRLRFLISTIKLLGLVRKKFFRI